MNDIALWTVSGINGVHGNHVANGVDMVALKQEEDPKSNQTLGLVELDHATEEKIVRDILKNPHPALSDTAPLKVLRSS